MAPSRGPSFDGQLFFVYDREAVTKESDPPEDAIMYFYPPSASIENRISICGQLVGVSNFLTSVLDFAPVLIKLKTEKVALYQSGKYTMALGGTSAEPESLLIRQLNALVSVFAFYHGSFDNVEKFSKDQISFLSNMTIIWDCYLPFIRYYGDTLPAVFDPLPFLKTPKNSSGCFLKASHILQACQRRRHILGGCILYKKSVLCTQLESCITRRLLLLKPNQSHHPSKQVKTEINLPFGVRILHSFLTLCEYERLINEFSRSPYRQSTPLEAITSSTTQEQDIEGNSADSGERFSGLLHKSVRKRIESESQGLTQGRESLRKAKSNKQARQKVRERTRLSRARTSIDKEVSRSTLKREQDKHKEEEVENKVPHGNELRIDLSSENYDQVTLNTVEENREKEDKHKHDEVGKRLSLGNEYSDQVITENSVDKNTKMRDEDQGCTTDLTQNEERTHSFNGESLSQLSCNNGTEATRDDCYYDDCIPGEDELTMDEVDVKDLTIITGYHGKNDSKSYSSGRCTSKLTTEEYTAAVNHVCYELINELIEQIVSDREKRSPCRTLLNSPIDDVPTCTNYPRACDAEPTSDIHHDFDIPNLHESQPALLSLVDEASNRGLVCNSNEEIKDNVNGISEEQHGDIVTVATEKNDHESTCNNCSNESELGQNTEQSKLHHNDKVPFGAIEATPTVSNPCSTTDKLEPSTQENCEKIITSANTEESPSNGILHRGPRQSPKAILINSSSVAHTDPNDTSLQDCESPGSAEYQDSFEDLVTDGAKSEARFIEETEKDLSQNYGVLNKKEFEINKYSSRNLNVPEEKNLNKFFFNDIVDGAKKNVTNTSDNDNVPTVDSTSESLDSENCAYGDSRTSSVMSENDTSVESFTRGCPGDCKSTLGDSGVCLFHETENPSTYTEPETVKAIEVSSPSMPTDCHGNDSSWKPVKQVTEHTKEKDDKEEDHEELDDNAFQVDEMVHLNLYVQAHSNTVLILLAENPLHKDHETIKALWKTSLNELGELEVRLNQCQENVDQSLKPEDYGYLVYDGLSNTTKGNLEEPVLQVDHMFCDTAKTVHEQFNNCSSLRSVTLRNSSSAVHCQRSLGQEVYFHKKGSFKSFLGSPSTRDPAFSLEKRACKLLHKDHGVNVF